MSAKVSIIIVIFRYYRDNPDGWLIQGYAKVNDKGEGVRRKAEFMSIPKEQKEGLG